MAGWRTAREQDVGAKKRDRRTETYTTSDWDGNRGGAPEIPVIAMMVLPGGDVHMLDDIQDCYGTKKWISVGASCTSDIRLFEKLDNDEEPSVSRDHCELCRTPQGRVFVQRCEGARNSTKINRARIHTGMMEMAPGDILQVGRLELLAIGADKKERLRIAADDWHDYVDRVVRSKGSPRKAASFFGKHFATITRWLKKGDR